MAFEPLQIPGNSMNCWPTQAFHGGATDLICPQIQHEKQNAQSYRIPVDT
jgi:hypothetical protein